MTAGAITASAATRAKDRFIEAPDRIVTRRD